ncbi:MAG: hypothetical protein PHI24_09310 [Desulfitobacteriaceae bacterium]|nr:hypothetical protein [Desulfitobacteriaceae bacterium]
MNSGEIERRAILVTCDTRFESKGFFYDMPIWTTMDTREVMTRDGFLQTWHVYHEKSRQEIARNEYDRQVWTAQLEKAIKEKAQVEKKIKNIESQIAAQEKKIASLENQKQQLIESWDKQYKSFAKTVNKDLNRIAITYVDEKVLPGKLAP